MSWYEAGRLAEIPARGARVLKTDNGDVAVFRTSDDEVFALADRCPHKHGPLSQGIVHGSRVTCPLHDWIIDLDSGNAVGPDVGCTSTYPVKVQDGHVYVDIPDG